MRATICFYSIFLISLIILTGTIAKASDPGLVNFSVMPAEDHTKIKWSARGFDHDYFVVEKSNDGKAFEEAERVASNELIADERPYSVEDFNPFPGRSYYRLKLAFKDGSFRYSKIIALIFNSDVEFRFEVFPTPTSGNFSLSFKGVCNPEEVISVDILTLRGRIVMSAKAPLKDLNGDQMIFQNANQALTAGTYIVKGNLGHRQFHQRLIIE